MLIVGLNIKSGGGTRFRSMLDLMPPDVDVLVLSEYQDQLMQQKILHEPLRKLGFTHFSYEAFAHTETRLTEAQAKLVGMYSPKKGEPAKRVRKELGQKINRVLIASKMRFKTIDLCQWIVAAEMENGLTICGVYMPQNYKKESVFRCLMSRQTFKQRFVLVGDLNTGNNTLDIDGSRDWFKCENHFNTISQNMTDAWRYFNSGKRDFSFSFIWNARTLSQWRIDHAFVSKDLSPALVSCEYDHVFSKRTSDGKIILSDHSAIMLRLDDSLLAEGPSAAAAGTVPTLPTVP